MKRHGPWSRVPGVLAVIAVLSCAAPALAHPRPWEHGHDRRPSILAAGKSRPLRALVVVNKHRFGSIDLNVKPRRTEVWVDGQYYGVCDVYDGSPDKLYLSPGTHALMLVTPEGVAVRQQVEIRAGVELNVGLDLR